MSYIKAINGTIIKYPYTRDDLTRDNPNVSFPIDPTSGDLEPFNTFMIESTEKPILEDPRTQRVEREIPIFEDGRWKEKWKIRTATPQEIEDYDLANVPNPNWEKFKERIIQSSTLNSTFLSALSSAPIAVSMLTAALTNITNTKSSEDFLSSWKTLIELGLISSDVISELIQLATESNLPENFIISIQENSQ